MVKHKKHAFKNKEQGVIIEHCPWGSRWYNKKIKRIKIREFERKKSLPFENLNYHQIHLSKFDESVKLMHRFARLPVIRSTYESQFDFI